MQANWSLILNVLLLIGVVTAIGRLMKVRKQSLIPETYQPSLGKVDNSPYDMQPLHDDIIAVRKISSESLVSDTEEPVIKVEKIIPKMQKAPNLTPQDEIKLKPVDQPKANEVPATMMFFLLAKENRQFAGYELLQTVLATGLRFGEGHLFHRHQFANGQGPVLCSLAAATATGIFDLQNIGAFSVRGLCLFMHASKNPSIDAERFSIMLETARQLSEGLDAHLLDDRRKPLNDAALARYYTLLNIEQE